jgi:NAD(P)-dependent dehydrogenase (short-subunit alcohol dehydrogenase family)
MDLQLHRRTVLVTGSSAGIGKATAVAFGREGARVAVTYHTNRQGAEQTAAQITEAGGEALVVPYHLSDDQSIRAAVQTIREQWGAIDVLVNNAPDVFAIEAAMGGSAAKLPPFEEVAPDRWRVVIRALLEGVYLTTQAVLPDMRAQRWGRIVNISSNLAEDGRPGMAAYTSAKAGLHGLTQTLALEMGPFNILTNVVMPGLTLSERAMHDTPINVREQVARITPTRRLTMPEDVAALILFLGSAANRQINGERIRVSGGA